MGDQYLGEIRMVGFNFAPVGWALCNGQTMSISQNNALFALLGTTYGGNGTQTFGLPNLQSRIPMHAGQGGGLSARALGAFGGIEGITLQTTPIPGSPVSPVNANVGHLTRLSTVSPFLVLNFTIALQGIFPSQS